MSAPGTESEAEVIGYPCPACGSPLYGWVAAHDPLRRGEKVVIDRCENCRLAVTRTAEPPDAGAELDTVIERNGDGTIAIEAANVASVQGGLGGAQWAGLEPELRRLHLSPDSVRRLLAKRGIEVTDARTPYTRASFALMRQTLINAFTLRDNFLRNARAGRLPPPSSLPDRLLVGLDYIVSWLVWVPCTLVAYPLERGAARLGRGGTLLVEGTDAG